MNPKISMIIIRIIIGHNTVCYKELLGVDIHAPGADIHPRSWTLFFPDVHSRAWISTPKWMSTPWRGCPLQSVQFQFFCKRSIYYKLKPIRTSFQTPNSGFDGYQ